MSRETEDYRITLAGLNEKYGDTDLIKISCFAKRNGDMDIRTASKMIKELKVPVVHKFYINKYSLARAMSQTQK